MEDEDARTEKAYSKKLGRSATSVESSSKRSGATKKYKKSQTFVKKSSGVHNSSGY